MRDIGRREHGTESAYQAGCRCSRCVAAASVARQERKAKKNGVVSAAVTSISSARGGRGRDVPAAPAGPGEVEVAVREATKEFTGDPWLVARVALAVRLAREIDNASTAVAPMVNQLQKMLEELQRKGGSSGARSGGQPAWAGTR